ncbi:MAG: von Willebrand factor type A domain-containing protein, partial [Pseudomonadota bacterium]
YDTHGENPFIEVAEENLSTFGLDVDSASYSYARGQLNSGKMPDPLQIRTEEFINYFSYNPKAIKYSDESLSVSYEVGKAPWAPGHRLIKTIVQANEIPVAAAPPLNLVFLIDVSGSMLGENRLGLAKYALNVLVGELRKQDRISIVTYAGTVGVPLKGAKGSEKEKIKDVINQLGAGGSTAGGAGIQTAYEIAQDLHRKGKISRVVLSTDGDFNVGISDTKSLVNFVKKQAESGVYLTVHGYGMGNFNDGMLEGITNVGNGNYAYIDNRVEAERVFRTQLSQTMVVAAKDVKVQMDFNPLTVKSYRLIGYENRVLDNDDFIDVKVDAGDLGSGQRVVAFYEVIMREDAIELFPIPLLTFNMRYKNPKNEEKVKQLALPFDDFYKETSGDFCFASSVAAFGLKLRQSRYIGEASFADIKSWVLKCNNGEQDPQRSDFVHFVDQAISL